MLPLLAAFTFSAVSLTFGRWHRRQQRGRCPRPPLPAPATAPAMAKAIAMATAIATATVAVGSPPLPARDKMIEELKAAQVARQKRLQIIY
uniref:Uncharacterized protein n=1 Tax=Globodera pallida TaxID=36090 RepID=A0A183CFP2_GLOPA